MRLTTLRKACIERSQILAPRLPCKRRVNCRCGHVVRAGAELSQRVTLERLLHTKWRGRDSALEIYRWNCMLRSLHSSTLVLDLQYVVHCKV
jgi:hypothetical protein